MEEHAPGIGSQGASDAPERIATEQDNMDLGDLDMNCRICYPHACDDPDIHLGVPSEYTPLKNKGCICGADIDGRDCMCFENEES